MKATGYCSGRFELTFNSGISSAPCTGMRTIFLVVAAFLLTWFPMLVLALLDVVSSAARLDWTPPGWLHVFAMWSMCAGSVTYPILYGMYNRAIRKELRLCLSWSPANWPLAHHLYAGQRRGSKWSNYSGNIHSARKLFRKNN